MMLLKAVKWQKCKQTLKDNNINVHCVKKRKINFNGVLSVCIAEGMDLEKSYRYAVVASEISAGRNYILDGIPTKIKIDKFMEEKDG